MDDLAALGVPPELREPLRTGRLEQRCPRDCREGWRRTYPGPEAAGFSCSACGVETGPADWYKPAASDKQKASLSRAQAARRKRLDRRSQLAKTATAGPLASPPVPGTLGL